MRKVIFTIAAAVICAASASAQDLAKLTEIYNNGANSLNNGEKVEALASFKEALTGAEALGDAGKDLAANCKDIIPSLVLSLAKDTFKTGEFDAAIALAQEAAGYAKAYNNADVAKEAADLIRAFNEQKAAGLLKNKDFAGAIAAYTELLADKPEDGKLLFRLAQAYEGSGDIDKAVETYIKASENGESKTALKKLSTIYLKKASADLKAKNFNGAIENSNQSLSYSESANAYKILGTASVQLKKFDAAAEAFTKYLQINPAASDAEQIKATIDFCNKQPK